MMVSTATPLWNYLQFIMRSLLLCWETDWYLGHILLGCCLCWTFVSDVVQVIAHEDVKTPQSVREDVEISPKDGTAGEPFYLVETCNNKGLAERELPRSVKTLQTA